MGTGWTDERRAKQALAIQRWKPWEQSTGPRTAEGKVVVGQNAHRLTIRKLYLMAVYAGKQQAAMLAGLPWDGRAELVRRLEACICEPSGIQAG